MKDRLLSCLAGGLSCRPRRGGLFLAHPVSAVLASRSSCPFIEVREARQSCETRRKKPGQTRRAASQGAVEGRQDRQRARCQVGSKTATKAKPVPSSTKSAPVAKAEKATAKDEPKKALKVRHHRRAGQEEARAPAQGRRRRIASPAKSAGAKRGRKPKAGGDKPEEDEDLSDIEAEFADEPAAETTTDRKGQAAAHEDQQGEGTRLDEGVRPRRDRPVRRGDAKRRSA
jgi:hypothetical protein